jgi:hypothetical protein
MKFAAATLFTVTLACARTEAPTPDGSASSTMQSTGVQSTTTAPSATAGDSTTTAATTTLTPAPPPAGLEPVAGPKLTPIDQASADPSLVAYRESLLAAAKKRDAKAVAALVDPKIRTSFGDGGGAKDFEQMLAKPDMWAQLETVLTHGGSFLTEGTSRAFWAPYVYSAWPETKDAFEYVAVIGEDVPLRKSADAKGEVLAILAHDLVERPAPPAEGAKWVRVKTADGRIGFVETSAVMSPVGYRAGFVQRDGKWLMNAFVAGD